MAKITRGSDHGAARYKYDFGPCRFDKGWAQVDTTEDASYYGTWANPLTLETFSFMEGDTTHVQCDDAADFAREIREMVEWQRNAEIFKGIDGMCQTRIIDAFATMGLAEFLHGGSASC